MLAELNVTNFAIIDRLNLSLDSGFNVMTGETGAGKSIIIDAVSALLGGRFGQEFIRFGATQARIEGIFSVPAVLMRQLLPLLYEQGLADEYPDLVAEYEQAEATAESAGPPVPVAELAEYQLILSREINKTGRSTLRVNGRAVSQAILQQVAQNLVDIHGQSEHVSLMRVSEHLNLLDEYAGLLPQRRKVAAKVAELRAVRRELQSLMKDEAELARRIDLLKFQIEEIKTARLKPGEEEDLKQEHTLLANAERLAEAADGAYSMLYEAPDPESKPALELLSSAQRCLEDLARLDPSLEADCASLQEACYAIEEVARSVRNYRENIEFNPQRLQSVQERLDLINRLKRKYGGADYSIEAVLEFAKESAAELDKIEHSEERIAELNDEQEHLLGEIGVLAAELALERRAAGERLSRAVEQELADLGMGRARFAVEQRFSPDPDGAPLSRDAAARLGLEASKRYSFDATGLEKLEFMLAANPGEPIKPLVKVASGGETSRLMLALKTILSRADAVPTLIFDEIDVGVGGRTGQIVGEKLWNLTGNHQVICVTHLPQLACFADAHYNITKRQSTDHTMTQVRLLDERDRITEITSMLGSSDSSVGRQNASELIRRAETWKQRDSGEQKPDNIISLAGSRR